MGETFEVVTDAAGNVISIVPESGGCGCVIGIFLLIALVASVFMGYWLYIVIGGFVTGAILLFIKLWKLRTHNETPSKAQYVGYIIGSYLLGAGLIALICAAVVLYGWIAWLWEFLQLSLILGTLLEKAWPCCWPLLALAGFLLLVYLGYVLYSRKSK